jgi:hypothetical protein
MPSRWPFAGRGYSLPTPCTSRLSVDTADDRVNDGPAGQVANSMSALWRAALRVVILLTLPGSMAAGADQPAAFVGAQTCAGCHMAQFDAWKGSHHALAMQPATTTTVLGDFAGASLEHFGVATTFFRNGDTFMARTDGPDGALHDYPIAYTFGIYSLQQYLIEFPGGRRLG